jgi:hypothetical protein
MACIAMAVDDDNVRSDLAKLPADRTADDSCTDDHYTHKDFFMLSAPR